MKEQSELQNDEARMREEERRKQKDAVAKLKAQQRAEVDLHCISSRKSDNMTLFTSN